MRPQTRNLAFKAVVFTLLFALTVYLPRYKDLCEDYQDQLVESALQEGALQIWLNHACRNLTNPFHQFLDESFPHPDVIESCVPLTTPVIPLGVSATHFSNEACNQDFDTFKYTESDGSSFEVPHHYFFAYRKNCNFRTNVRVKFISWSPYWAFFLSLLLPLPLWTANSGMTEKKPESIDGKAHYHQNRAPWWYAIPMSIFHIVGEYMLFLFMFSLPPSTMTAIVICLSLLLMIFSLPSAIHLMEM